jgi:uncharacterized membrane protein
VKPIDRAQPYIIGVLFIVAGSIHFANPKIYEAIMPPYLPAHHALVAISGFCEILGGIGAMIPQTRKAAGIGLIALLVAVFPANLYMATDAAKFASFAPAWALWARLPIQLFLIAWVYNATVAPPKKSN